MKPCSFVAITLAAIFLSSQTEAWAGPPLNDQCIYAQPLDPNQTVPGTTVGANQHPDVFSTCHGSVPGGDGVWYLLSGSGTEVSLTLDCVSGQHELIVFCDNCQYPQCLATSVSCGQSATWCAGWQVNYRVLVRSPIAPGDFTLTFSESEVACQATEGCADWPPYHDRCENRNTLWPGFTLHGTTVGASFFPDLFPGCDGRVPGGNGVWFEVFGNWTNLTATLECSGSEHEMIAFCSSCFQPEYIEDEPLCVAPPSGCGESMTWCSDQGTLLLVRSMDTPGDFTITLQDSNEACNADLCIPLSNNTCTSAYPAPLGAPIRLSTHAATDEGDLECGPSPGASVWFTRVGDGTVLTASVCSVPAVNQVHTLSLMCNSCAAPRCIPGGFAPSACAEGGQISWCSKPGETYYLRVDGPELSSAGEFDLSVISEGPCGSYYDCAPPNDSCNTAQALDVGQDINLSTAGATLDHTPYCGVYDFGPGVWYDVVGDGTILEASICNVFGSQPWVKVFCDDCKELACVETSYSEAQVPLDVCEQHTVNRWRWCSKPGVTYKVFVVDYESSPEGWFSFAVKSTGTACANSADCIYDPPPANDRCADAIPIAGEGVFPFENTYATPEEPYDMCHFTGQNPPTHDVWYCWTSPCDGHVTVETCGLTTVDTQLAVYPGCDCREVFDLNCNNDNCGYQSRLDFIATAGQTYRIQVGTFIGLGGGSGQFRISCGLEPAVGSPCASRAFGECLARSQDNALNSTRGQYVAADNFTTKESFQANEICWWGGNFNGEKSCVREAADDFRVTYYADYCGKPWGLIGGPFSQSAGTLFVTGPGRRNGNIAGLTAELEYTGSHASVPLAAGQPYWIEITNSASGECSWFWETLIANDPASFQSIDTDAMSSNARILPADVAFQVCRCTDDCVDRTYAPSCSPIPENDDCETSVSLGMGDVVAFKTTGASTDGVPVVPQQAFGEELRNYFPLGDRQVHKDVWFYVNPFCDGTMALDVCHADFDVKTALYDVSRGCSSESPIAIDDDSCGADLGLQSRLTAFVDNDYYYMLRVGGYRGDFGSGEVTWNYAAPESSDLRVFAAYANCRRAACATQSCNPPLYADFCCFAQDFDADGDVDLLDYRPIHDSLIGP